MLTKQQLMILNVFTKNIFSEFTFKQIKGLSKQKSNNIVQIALREFTTQNLMLTRRVGNVTIYSLNLNNNMTLYYLQLLTAINLEKLNIPNTLLSDIQKKILRYTEFFVLLVFGSYAKNRSNTKSDLDVAIIVESEQTKKEVTPLIETIKRRELVSIDYYVFTRQEFLEMLYSDNENVGKQIFDNNIVFYGYLNYCNMMSALWEKKQRYTLIEQKQNL